MKKIGGLFIVLGILISIPYMIYVTNFSGETLDTFTIKSGVGGFVGNKLVSVGRKKASGKMGPIALSTDMNPLRVNLNLHFNSMKKSGLLFKYTANISDSDGLEIWQKSGRKTKQSDKENKQAKGLASISLGVFSVDQDGNYFLNVDLTPASGTQIHNASIEIRRNAMLLNPIVLGSGGAVFLLGLILAYAGKKKEHTSQP